MGSGFFGGGCGNLVSLLLVSNYPAVINYKIFRKLQYTESTHTTESNSVVGTRW